MGQDLAVADGARSRPPLGVGRWRESGYGIVESAEQPTELAKPVVGVLRGGTDPSWAGLVDVSDIADDDLAAWDRAAGSYAEQPQVDWFDEFLDRHLGEVAGKRILDLGCGDGWFAERLRTRGAVVDAVDGSGDLLEIARQRYPSVDFRQVDLRTGIQGEYDVVVALMVLMDLPNLAVVRPRLRAGGVLVATVLHPAFFLQRTVDDELGGYRQVRGYLDEEEWWIESFGGHRHYHRPISAYVNWISSLGLGVVELFEPPAAVYDGWRARIPTRLGFAARPIAS